MTILRPPASQFAKIIPSDGFDDDFFGFQVIARRTCCAVRQEILWVALEVGHYS